MTVSKRVRFAVLQRDNHTCQYCGGSPPAVVLQIDHVIPVALGGSDDPSNLVTACEPCNSGKTSTSPTGEVVARVNESAVRWASAMQQAAEELAAARERDQVPMRRWIGAWSEYGEPLPDDWRTSLRAMLDSGAQIDVLIEMIGVAMSSRARDTFRYFCGCAWNHVAALRARAVEILDGQAPNAPDGQVADPYMDAYWAGFDVGYEAGLEQAEIVDSVAARRISLQVEPEPIGAILQQLKEGA